MRENWSAVSAAAETALPHDLRLTGVLALSNSRGLARVARAPEPPHGSCLAEVQPMWQNTHKTSVARRPTGSGVQKALSGLAVGSADGMWDDIGARVE